MSFESCSSSFCLSVFSSFCGFVFLSFCLSGAFHLTPCSWPCTFWSSFGRSKFTIVKFSQFYNSKLLLPKLHRTPHIYTGSKVTCVILWNLLQPQTVVSSHLSKWYKLCKDEPGLYPLDVGCLQNGHNKILEAHWTHLWELVDNTDQQGGHCQHHSQVHLVTLLSQRNVHFLISKNHCGR